MHLVFPAREELEIERGVGVYAMEWVTLPWGEACPQITTALWDGMCHKDSKDRQGYKSREGNARVGLVMSSQIRGKP